jgi:hypothetical protein
MLRKKLVVLNAYFSGEGEIGVERADRKAMGHRDRF